MAIETSFPRGGKKEAIHKTQSRGISKKTDYDLFGKKKRKAKKIDLRNEMGQINVVEKDICSKEIVITSVDLPTYKSIREGFVTLGCVREIQKMAINILLPGRISGRVNITQISEPYTRLLREIAENRNPEEFKPIKEIYTPGQKVAVKVVRINNDDQKCQISLSMDPKEVNADLNYQNVTPGMLLWGAITSIEEHGYVVELGIKNCRAFLPKSNTEDSKMYFKGQVLWCVVQKYTIDGSASTATLNVREEKIENTLIIKDVSLNHLLPGMFVDLTVNRVLSNGLEGKFLNDYFGYVHESFVRGNEKLERFKVGQILQARIMYIEPVTKLTYLTLKKFTLTTNPELTEGSLVTATIQNITRGGLYLLLNKKYKGFVSFKRLKQPLPFNADLDYTDLVKKNYKVNSTHPGRILSYDYLEQLYVCTLEKDMVKETHFSYDDLKLGEQTLAEVIEIQKNGLLVQIGRITGFILNEHLTETSLTSYEKLKSKYKVGQKLRAKIFSVNRANASVLLTLKPTFLKTESNLVDFSLAKHNCQYPGIVVQITQNGLLVRFFGDIKGWVPKTQLSFEKVDHPEKMFKIGQIVNCTILKCENDKLTLSLHPPKATSKKKSLRLGQCVSVRVTEVMVTALQVEVVGTNVGAVIPSMYLTEHQNLASELLKTFKVGDIIENVICLTEGHGVPILSLRDSDLETKTIKTFETVAQDDILACSLHSVTKEGILLSHPIKGFDKLIFVPNDRVCEMSKKINSLNLRKYQRIYARVTKVQKNNQHIYGSTELSKVWHGDLTVSVKILGSYLSDYDKVREWFEKENNSLSKFKLGQMVSGVVSKIQKGNKIIINIDNYDNIKGKIHALHASEGVKLGDKVSATVLFVNYQQNYLELIQKDHYKSRINPLQNGKVNCKLGKNVMADILLVKREFILVSLRGNGNRQLCYLPAQLHFNDLIPNTHIYKIGTEIKVQVLQIENKHIIGIARELVKNFEKAKKAAKLTKITSNLIKIDKNSRKRKLEDSNQQLTLANKKGKMADDQNQSNSRKTKMADNDNQSESSNKIATILNSNNDSDENLNENESENEEIDSDLENQMENSDESENSDEESKNMENGVQLKRSKMAPISNEQNSDSNVENENSENDDSDDENMENEVSEGSDDENEDQNEDSESSDNEIDLSSESSNEENGDENAKVEISSDEEEIPKISQKNKKTLEEPRNLESSNKKKKKSQKTTDEVISNGEKVCSKKSDITPILSGVSSFWEIPKLEKVLEQSSDDDDENDEKEDLKKKQKKKKLTSAEKSELARQEEERLRKIEMELADQESAPKTADQFDRLVMANPNNSLLWINYIAFHLEATEIEKARAIARKALKTIEFREEQEKLNVWIAFLNLENRYGTKESFSSILDEALKMNDSLTVHLQALNILAESNKTSEFLELLNKVTKRYKQESKMWIGVGEACYKCDQKEQARNLMQRAVKSLEEKQHVNLIVQFAFMESKWGESERAEAILEKVLASYPKRVDIWCSYVDMLVKADRIHVARNVLERAVSQKLPPKKIKTLFTKFVQFEKKHGDEDSVKKVRQLASEYVQEVLK